MLEVEHRLVQREPACAGTLEGFVFAHGDPPSSCGLIMPDREVPCRGAVGHNVGAHPRPIHGPFALVTSIMNDSIAAVVVALAYPHVLGKRVRSLSNPQQDACGGDHEDPANHHPHGRPGQPRRREHQQCPDDEQHLRPSPRHVDIVPQLGGGE